MAFTVTHTLPTINSKITVKFAGLVILRPNGANMCDIGIHRFNSTHLFQAFVIVDKPKLPPTLIRLTNGPLTAQFKIVADPVTTHFKVFTRDDDPFDPNASGNDALDYRWAINMRDLNAGVDFNEGAQPIATLNDGILYTSNLSKDGLQPVLVQHGVEHPRKQIAADLSASINLPDGGTLNMTWGEAGDEKRFELPRLGFDPPNTTYTIILLNDPPAVAPSPHDELALFYKVLRISGSEVGENDQAQLIYKGAHKLDEIPCPPVTLNP